MEPKKARIMGLSPGGEILNGPRRTRKSAAPIAPKQTGRKRKGDSEAPEEAAAPVERSPPRKRKNEDDMDDTPAPKRRNTRATSKAPVSNPPASKASASKTSGSKISVSKRAASKADASQAGSRDSVAPRRTSAAGLKALAKEAEEAEAAKQAAKAQAVPPTTTITRATRSRSVALDITNDSQAGTASVEVAVAEKQEQVVSSTPSHTSNSFGKASADSAEVEDAEDPIASPTPSPTSSSFEEAGADSTEVRAAAKIITSPIPSLTPSSFGQAGADSTTARDAEQIAAASTPSRILNTPGTARTDSREATDAEQALDSSTPTRILNSIRKAGANFRGVKAIASTPSHNPNSTGQASADSGEVKDTQQTIATPTSSRPSRNIGQVDAHPNHVGDAGPRIRQNPSAGKFTSARKNTPRRAEIDDKYSRPVMDSELSRLPGSPFGYSPHDWNKSPKAPRMRFRGQPSPEVEDDSDKEEQEKDRADFLTAQDFVRRKLGAPIKSYDSKGNAIYISKWPELKGRKFSNIQDMLRAQGGVRIPGVGYPEYAPKALKDSASAPIPTSSSLASTFVSTAQAANTAVPHTSIGKLTSVTSSLVPISSTVFHYGGKVYHKLTQVAADAFENGDRETLLACLDSAHKATEASEPEAGPAEPQQTGSSSNKGKGVDCTAHPQYKPPYAQRTPSPSRKLPATEKEELNVIQRHLKNFSEPSLAAQFAAARRASSIPTPHTPQQSLPEQSDDEDDSVLDGSNPEETPAISQVAEVQQSSSKWSISGLVRKIATPIFLFVGTPSKVAATDETAAVANAATTTEAHIKRRRRAERKKAERLRAKAPQSEKLPIHLRGLMSDDRVAEIDRIAEMGRIAEKSRRARGIFPSNVRAKIDAAEVDHAMSENRQSRRARAESEDIFEAESLSNASQAPLAQTGEKRSRVGQSLKDGRVLVNGEWRYERKPGKFTVPGYNIDDSDSDESDEGDTSKDSSNRGPQAKTFWERLAEKNAQFAQADAAAKSRANTRNWTRPLSDAEAREENRNFWPDDFTMPPLDDEDGVEANRVPGPLTFTKEKGAAIQRNFGRGGWPLGNAFGRPLKEPRPAKEAKNVTWSESNGARYPGGNETTTPLKDRSSYGTHASADHTDRENSQDVPQQTSSSGVLEPKQWDQTPPPRTPRPGNAQLPVPGLGNTTAVNDPPNPLMTSSMEAVEKQRAKILINAPKMPSGLRSITKAPSPVPSGENMVGFPLGSEKEDGVRSLNRSDREIENEENERPQWDNYQDIIDDVYAIPRAVIEQLLVDAPKPGSWKTPEYEQWRYTECLEAQAARDIVDAWFTNEESAEQQQQQQQLMV